MMVLEFVCINKELSSNIQIFSSNKLSEIENVDAIFFLNEMSIYLKKLYDENNPILSQISLESLYLDNTNNVNEERLCIIWDLPSFCFSFIFKTGENFILFVPKINNGIKSEDVGDKGMIDSWFIPFDNNGEECLRRNAKKIINYAIKNCNSIYLPSIYNIK